MVRIRLYVPLSSSLSDSTCRVSTKRPAPLSFSLSLPRSPVSFLFLPLSLSFILCGCCVIFFYFIHRAYQSPAATLRNAISIFRHRMENLVTTLRRSPFNGGIFNAIVANAPSERAAIARESTEMEFVSDRL